MSRSKTSVLGTVLAALAVAACGSSAHSSTVSSSRSTAATSTAAASSTQAATGRSVTVKLPGEAAGPAGARPTALGTPAQVRRHLVQARLVGFGGEFSFSQRLVSYAQAVNGFWQHIAQVNQLNLLPATAHVIDQSPASCGSEQITTSDPFQYCAADRSVDLPVQFMASHVDPLGAAATLLVVSDMYGYNFLNSVGVLSSMSPTALQLSDACFSGFFFGAAPGVVKGARFTPGDEEAVTALLAQQGAGGSLAPAGSVTAQALIAAFNKGALGPGSVCLKSP